MMDRTERVPMRLVHGGVDYFQVLVGMIEAAREAIYLQTYIFDPDATGQMVADALVAAAGRGVKVQVMVDGFGSSSFGKGLLSQLHAAGVQARVFAPWLSWQTLHVGRRLHHKVVVVDGRHVLIGGINVADKYHGSATERAWLDFAVLLEDETLAKGLVEVCRGLYARSLMRVPPRLGVTWRGGGIKVLQNDWLLGKNQVQWAYRRAIRRAQEEVIIIGTYFLPGPRLLARLRRVARNGVRVKLVLSGTSDVPIVRRATRHLYGRMLRAGITLHEWPHSVLHGKAAVVDGKWATVGSFNLNALSAYGSIEMNLAIADAAFSGSARAAFEAVIADCVAIEREEQSRWQRVLDWTSHALVRLGFALLTFTSYRRLWAPRDVATAEENSRGR